MEPAVTSRESTTPVSGDELIRMSGLDPCELVAGRVVPMTPADSTHGRIEANVAAALKHFVRTQNLGLVMAGAVGVFTSRYPDTVRAPDVLFLSHERDARRERPQGFLDVAPELTVEILSPTDRSDHVRRKLGEYFAAGVRQVWVIDPASRTVQIHHGCGEPESLAPGATLTGGDLLPGFRLPVHDIFE